MVLIGCIFSEETKIEKSESQILYERKDSLMLINMNNEIVMGRSVPGTSICGELPYVEGHSLTYSDLRYSDTSNYVIVKIPKMWYETDLISNKEAVNYLKNDSLAFTMLTWFRDVDESSDSPLFANFDIHALIANEKSKYCGLDTVYQYASKFIYEGDLNVKSIYLTKLTRRNVIGYRIPSYFQHYDLCTSGKTKLYPWGNVAGYKDSSYKNAYGIYNLLTTDEWVDDYYNMSFIIDNINSNNNYFLDNPNWQDSMELVRMNQDSELITVSRANFIGKETDCNYENYRSRPNSFYGAHEWMTARLVIQSIEE